MTVENQSREARKKPRNETSMGATPAIAAEELDPGRERRPLESYFQEIGGTRTLRREEEVILAKDLEAATARENLLEMLERRSLQKTIALQRKAIALKDQLIAQLQVEPIDEKHITN